MVNMKKSLFLSLVLSVLLLVSCGNPVSRVVRKCGSSSAAYDTLARPYAVFDFDNTSIEGDISLAALVHLIETMDFRLAPDVLYSSFLNCIPEIDRPLEGFPGKSARMLATDIYSDYIWLYDNYIKGKKLSLDEIHESPQYKDFRAKLWALSAGADATFGSAEVGCLWIMRPFGGMTGEELTALVREAAGEAMKEKVKTEKWTSPDSGEAGEVSVEVPRGLRIGKKTLSLFRRLERRGFDVYVCSAASETIVEALACDPDRFALPAERVFGIRLSSGGYVSPSATCLPGYPVTYGPGKTELIRSRIMPGHGGQDPAIVAGDSNGDWDMLTDFPDMKLGLIVDRPAGGKIAELKKKGGRRYQVVNYR